MDDGVDPFFRAAVHRESEKKTRYSQPTPAKLPLARHLLVVQTMGMQTRGRFQPPTGGNVVAEDP